MRDSSVALGASLLTALVAPGVEAASGIVPDDFGTIQAALDQAGPGDTLQVRAAGGPYREKIEFRNGGDATLGFVSLEAFPGDRPVLDGTGIGGSDMVLIDTKSYVRLAGFEIRNNLGVDDGSGVRILGSGTRIEILDNVIHDIRGLDAMGITVYGTSRSASISELVIDGNEIYDCEPARSEALTLNGNVEDFAVTNNIVRDVNNIGIDFIGGETDINPDPGLVVRNGVCIGNQVYRANSNYGGGYGAGIYVDGARDIVIERNLVSECDLGIEIGAENAGIETVGILVRDNLIFRNDKVGIVFGGFDAMVGTVRNCSFTNNTLFENDTFGEGLGEFWIQYAEGNTIRNNIAWSTDQNVMVYSEEGNTGNTIDHNLWFGPGGDANAEFVWRGMLFRGLGAFQAGTGQGTGSLFADPLLVDPAAADFHLTAGSPAIDRGQPGFTPGVDELDIDGATRLVGTAIDLGADEVGNCASAIGVATGLLGIKDGTDAVFVWTAATAASEHHLNSVADPRQLTAPGPHRPPVPGGVGDPRCDVAAPVTTCTDPGVLATSPDLRYYQLLGACGPGGDAEGPIE